MKNRETWLQKRPCAQFSKEIITKKEKQNIDGEIIPLKSRAPTMAPLEILGSRHSHDFDDLRPCLGVPPRLWRNIAKQILKKISPYSASTNYASLDAFGTIYCVYTYLLQDRVLWQFQEKFDNCFKSYHYFPFWLIFSRLCEIITKQNLIKWSQRSLPFSKDRGGNTGGARGHCPKILSV